MDNPSQEFVFPIKNQEYSKEIQKFLFSLGYHWLTPGEDIPKFLYKTYIFARSGSILTHSDNGFWRRKKSLGEHRYKDLIVLYKR